MNLGIAELWSVRFPEASRHLEEGLTLARRIERPYLEVGCLAHLAMAALLTGLPASVALQRSEEAVAIAESHGWATDPVAAAAFAVGGQLLVRLGRFAEAERWLERAERALHPGEPGTELVLRISQGLLQMGRGRLDDALAAFRAGEQMQALLAGEHALTAEVRNRILQIQIRMGGTAAGPAALARVTTLADDRAGARITTAAVHLPKAIRSRRQKSSAPVIGREVTALHPAWAALEASLFDAAAREQLGDRRAAEESIERALDLAEPEGAILPFALVPVRDLLERHPRHRTAHASLLSDDPRRARRILAAKRPRPCGTSSAKPSCASSGTYPATSKRPRSRPSSTSRQTPCAPTSAISTPSSTPTLAARRFLARANSACYRPYVATVTEGRETDALTRKRERESVTPLA